MVSVDGDDETMDRWMDRWIDRWNNSSETEKLLRPRDPFHFTSEPLLISSIHRTPTTTEHVV